MNVNVQQFVDLRGAVWPYPPWTGYLFVPFGLIPKEAGIYALHFSVRAARQRRRCPPDPRRKIGLAEPDPGLWTLARVIAGSAWPAVAIVLVAASLAACAAAIRWSPDDLCDATLFAAA